MFCFGCHWVFFIFLYARPFVFLVYLIGPYFKLVPILLIIIIICVFKLCVHSVHCSVLSMLRGFAFFYYWIIFIFFYITDHNFGRNCSNINNLADYWIMSWYPFHFLYYTSLHPEISGSYKAVYRLPNQAGLAAPFKWHYCSLITFIATATENLRGRWKISIRKKSAHMKTDA